jgi:glycosyltransferase involved in cell wall biosynthesis
MQGKAVPELVSTIIPVYNRAEMIESAVQSVLDQTYRPIEIILVNDGSTDNTLEELRRLESEHPDIIRVATRENGGPGLARETGRQLARGEFIQYFDSDDVLMPRKFEVQVAALRKHPECDIAYCRSSLIDQDGKTLREPSKWTGRQYDTLFPALLVKRWWHTHTPLYRTSLCDCIGEWPAKRPEDWDVDARAGALGVRLAFCDEVLSCQRHHDGERVTNWSFEEYLKDEALFLPRLFDCAVRAGIKPDTPEMKHFSRWAFAHARRAGAQGDVQLAKQMMELSRRASSKAAPDRFIYGLFVRIFGWKTAVKIVESLNGERLGRKHGNEEFN